MSVNNSMTTNSAPNYLYQVFTRPYPHIKLTPVSSKEISEIIKALNGKIHMVMMRYQQKC